MNSTDSVEDNFQQMKRILERGCPEELPDGVVFPENSLFLKIAKQTQTQGLSLKHPVFKKLQELSCKHKTDLFLSAPLKEKGRIYNATIRISPEKPPTVVYRKIHLFDVAIDESHFIRESSVFSPGSAPQTLQWKGWKIGFCICYDLRFAELSLFYGRNSVDLIFFPSAFLKSTGVKHWEILLRARAIENQCYVLAPAQSGKHISRQGGKCRFTYGHSLGVGPQGEVLYDMKHSRPKMQILSLNKNDILKFRTQIPIKKHRRLK